MKIKGLITTVCSLCLLCLPTLIFAQGNPGPDPDAIPFDGGLSLLIGAGVAYGVKKAYDKRKKDRTAGNEENKL